MINIYLLSTYKLNEGHIAYVHNIVKLAPC